MDDIKIYEIGSGGDFNIVGDDLESTSMLINQVYLALFGGNVEQSTSDDLNGLDQRNDWWGNQLMSPKNQFNSTLERTLDKVVLNSSGIVTLENAIIIDLEYLNEYADITVSVVMISVSRIRFDILLKQPNGLSVKVKFIWDEAQKELISQPIEDE